MWISNDALGRMVMAVAPAAWLMITSVWAQPVSAQEPTAGQSSVTLVSQEKMRISGAITIDTALEFTELRKSNPTVRTVELDSPGGLVYPALIIANQIHSAKINTWITGSSKCYSACSLVFLAGKMRLADGKLGVHQISGLDDSSQTQVTLSDIYDSLSAFRTPDKLISLMLRTPPGDIYVFSREELDQFGINIRPSDARKIARPHLQVISSTLHRDWLVGTFMNNRTQKPFIALESRQLDPVFRIVHYPHSLVTFAEIIWDERRFTEGHTELMFRFAHGNKL